VECLVEWVAWVAWVEWECNNPDPIKYSKRAVFTALFLLSYYKIKICQKDTVENHLKIQVLLKNLN
jgi:hypothetical protein